MMPSDIDEEVDGLQKAPDNRFLQLFWIFISFTDERSSR